MRLLITGGCGFIGANFIRYWAANHPKDAIVNLDKLTYAGNPDNLKGVSGNYQFIKGDICNAKSVEKAMVGVDTVVHFAAESHVDRSITGPQVFIKTNIIGTQVLMDAAVKHEVKRFHYISTDEVYGALALGTVEKFNELSAYCPNSPYSAAKTGAELVARSYRVTFGLPLTVTNCSNNYGPYQHPEKLVPLAITNLLVGKPVPIYGDGLYVRDWLFVTDHCRAIEAVLEKGKVGETYCVGGLTKDVSNLEVIKMMCQLMGKDFDTNVEYVTDRKGHDRRYAVDFSKIQRELGWSPQVSFEQGMKQTIDWYRENRWWWEKAKK